MFRIDPTGIKDRIASLDDLERTQLPYALREALNNTAEYVDGALVDEMRAVFDRPTPYTLRATRIFYATKTKLEARVWVKNEADKASPATKWLVPEIEGGGRNDKRAEVMLRDKGLMPGGKFVVPGKGAKLDRYGNISKGQLTKALSGVRGFSEQGYNANATDSKRSQAKRNAQRYFVMMKGKQPIGIAERTGKGSEKVQIILAFVTRPSYRKRFDFYGVAPRTAELRLATEFETALSKAMATRRR